MNRVTQKTPPTYTPLEHCRGLVLPASVWPSVVDQSTIVTVRWSFLSALHYWLLAGQPSTKKKCGHAIASKKQHLKNLGQNWTDRHTSSFWATWKTTEGCFLSHLVTPKVQLLKQMLISCCGLETNKITQGLRQSFNYIIIKSLHSRTQGVFHKVYSQALQALHLQFHILKSTPGVHHAYLMSFIQQQFILGALSPSQKHRHCASLVFFCGISKYCLECVPSLSVQSLGDWPTITLDSFWKGWYPWPRGLRVSHRASPQLPVPRPLAWLFPVHVTQPRINNMLQGRNFRQQNPQAQGWRVVKNTQTKKKTFKKHMFSFTVCRSRVKSHTFGGHSPTLGFPVLPVRRIHVASPAAMQLLGPNVFFPQPPTPPRPASSPPALKRPNTAGGFCFGGCKGEGWRIILQLAFSSSFSSLLDTYIWVFPKIGIPQNGYNGKPY